jgi:hypothetical protein
VSHAATLSVLEVEETRVGQENGRKDDLAQETADGRSALEVENDLCFVC